jgi:TonB family protein
MRRLFIYTLAFVSLLLSSAVSPAQTTRTQASVTSGNISSAEIERIVRAFTAKETEFRRALNEYAFKRDAVIQTIGLGGQITGEYHRVSFFTFDDNGNRFEKIMFFPTSTLTDISVTEQDIEDLGGVNPFALEASKINQYNFNYVGKEKIDELNLYVFDVAPKVAPDPKKTKERYFQGRIWVDDRDLQIVKVRGKGIPEDKNNKYPTFETYREQIDGHYWFPTYTSADDNLDFGNNVVHVRMLVRYSDFKRGHAEVKITEVNGDEIESTPEQKPSNNTKPSNNANPSNNTNPSNNPPQMNNAPPPMQSPTQTAPAAKSSSSTGTTGNAGRPMPLTGGVLNDYAIEMPAPKYPSLPKHITGAVKVDVTVDEQGRVIAAEATSGPKELRAAAVEAAKQARFIAPRLHGQLMKVEGTLVYKFD